MKKLMILALVLVLCLGAIGVGYAKWTDDITITGKLKTGSVDLKVMSYSGTWCYKNLCTHDLECYPKPQDDPNLLYVAGAWAEYGGADDTIKMTWDNIFPTCKYFTADASFLYIGTIPAVVECRCVPDAGSEWILDYIEIQFQVKHGDNPYVDIVCGETEIYEGDKIILLVKVKLPQDNNLMNKCASGTCVITLEQWDNCPGT